MRREDINDTIGVLLAVIMIPIGFLTSLFLAYQIIAGIIIMFVETWPGR